MKMTLFLIPAQIEWQKMVKFVSHATGILYNMERISPEVLCCSIFFINSQDDR
jgi:hypothetical protein